MTYEEFVERAEFFGLYDKIFPEELRMLDDDMQLNTNEIAELFGKHPESVRRWFQQGKIISKSPGHYKASALDVKRLWYYSQEKNLRRNKSFKGLFAELS